MKKFFWKKKIEVENFWWKFLEEMSYLISLNPLPFKNIAYIDSWKHFVFVFVCAYVSLSLHLSFSKPAVIVITASPDNKLSENIWFVWYRTSYSGDDWLKMGRRRRCHHNERTNKQTRGYSAIQLINTGSWVSQLGMVPSQKPNIRMMLRWVRCLISWRGGFVNWTDRVELVGSWGELVDL